ncbi:hypothetical protein B0H11DRAFT_2239182 [Mycena galericulata]|nr:hypothetical protein B0H11DRAFT_2239182 [Mycena galericulata]
MAYTTLATALGTTATALTFMANVAQFAPIPYAQQLISLAVSILDIAQRVQDNKAAFKQLANDTGEIVCAILSVVESRGPSPFLKPHLDGLVSYEPPSKFCARRVTHFVSLLEGIKDLASDHVSRHAVVRMFMNMADQKKIQDFRAQMSQALVVFGLKTQINVHENIVEILNELHKGRTEALQSAPSAGSDNPLSPGTVDTSTKSTPSPSSPPPTFNTSPPQIAADPPPAQTFVTNFNNSMGNVVGSTIGGTVTVMTVNGDYTAQNLYQYGGMARNFRAQKSTTSILLA